MNKILTLTAAFAIASAPVFAGSLAGVAEEADPFVAEENDGSRISPIILGLGGLLIIGGIIAASDSSSSSNTQRPAPR